MTSKIHITVNAVGRFCRMIVGAGAESDYSYAGALVKGYRPVIAMADKGYDAEWFINTLKEVGVADVVIPSRENKKVQRTYDKEKYKSRNIIERAFNRLKHYRRIATRYEKTARNFYSLICIAAAILNTK